MEPLAQGAEVVPAPPVQRGRRVVSAFIAIAFAQDDAEAVATQCRKVADQLRSKLPRRAALIDGAGADVRA